MAKARPDPSELRHQTLRIDKWLWQARFFKTRGQAAEIVTAGHVRVNGAKIAKASYGVSPGDTLTFAQGGRIRVIRVTGLGERRGPATEAQGLYHDHDGPISATPDALE